MHTDTHAHMQRISSDCPLMWLCCAGAFRCSLLQERRVPSLLRTSPAAELPPGAAGVGALGVWDRHVCPSEPMAIRVARDRVRQLERRWRRKRQPTRRSSWRRWPDEFIPCRLCRRPFDFRLVPSSSGVHLPVARPARHLRHRPARPSQHALPLRLLPAGILVRGAPTHQEAPDIPCDRFSRQQRLAVGAYSLAAVERQLHRRRDGPLQRFPAVDVGWPRAQLYGRGQVPSQIQTLMNSSTSI